MGYYFAGLFPMSSNCIELSSDDEVQIVEENVQTKNNVVWKTSNTNAIEKLSRNSNIELTINIEDFNFDNESSKSVSSQKKNGVIIHKQNNANKPPKEARKTSASNGYKSDSSDIEIVDVFEATPKREAIKPLTPFSTSPKLATLLSTCSQPRNTSASQNSNIIRALEAPLAPRTPLTLRSTHPSTNPSMRNDLPNKIGQKAPANVLKDIEKRINLSKNNNINSIDKSLWNQGRQSVVPPLKTKMQNPPNVNKIDNEVVIIDDDKSDDDSTPSVGPSSYTEHLVNILREKINEQSENKSKKKQSKAKASSTINKSPETEAARRQTKPKKRINPDVLISSTPINLEDNFRVTRRSVLLPPTPAPVNDPQQSTSNSKSLNIVNEPMNKYSIENMFSGLVKICKKIFTDETLEDKLWRTFKQASEQVLRSEEFINALKVALKTSEEAKIESLDDKLIVSREIKEVLRIMKRHPAVVNKKIKKLSRMLQRIRQRIRRLEEAEVTSDEEEENAYILLDRYRTRATKIYEKLCELQKTPSDAGRIVRQKLSFTGNSEFPKIEKAIEKYYQKTKSFPDFFDIKTLVEKTINKENLDIPPYKIHTIAQSLFLAFGYKLKRMRCFDDYTILNDYLEATRDPAVEDETLRNALASLDSVNKIIEGEQKILTEFACKELEKKCKEDAKSDESEASEQGGSEDERVVVNDVEKDLHFSDTDEELMNDGLQKDKRKAKSSDEEEETASNRKKKKIEYSDATESSSDGSASSEIRSYDYCISPVPN